VVVDDRTGNAKSCGHDAVRRQVRRCLPGEFLHDQVKVREFFARESLLENGREFAILLCEQREVTLRAAYISRKDHLFPLSLHCLVALLSLERCAGAMD
jgi:hypothetical protein